jgi:hypothetical protein
MWIDLMKAVYKDKPPEQFDTVPKALTTAAPEAAPQAGAEIVAAGPLPTTTKGQAQ